MKGRGPKEVKISSEVKNAFLKEETSKSWRESIKDQYAGVSAGSLDHLAWPLRWHQAGNGTRWRKGWCCDIAEPGCQGREGFHWRITCAVTKPDSCFSCQMLLLVMPFPARVRIGSVNRIFLLWWRATGIKSHHGLFLILLMYWAFQIYTVRHFIQLQIVFFRVFSVTSQFFSFIYKRCRTWAWRRSPCCHTSLLRLAAPCWPSQRALPIAAGVLPAVHKSFPCGASLTGFWKSKIKYVTFSCWFLKEHQ